MVYIFALVTIVLLSTGGFLLLRSRERNRKEILERVGEIDAARDEDAEEGSLLVGARRKSLIERILDDSAILAHVQTLVRQSGSSMTANGLLWRSLGTAAVGLLAGLILSHMLIGALAGFVVLGLAPYFWLRFKRTRRVKAFARCLPDTMDLIQRALQAGLALGEAFKRATAKARQPLAGEFGRVVVHVERGADLRAELIDLADRVPSPDLRMFVTAILVQRETGGNLPLILSRLSEMIRARYFLLGEMRSETAQGRLSAYILSLLPILVFLAIRFTDPKYLAPMFSTATGRHILWYAVISNVIGLVVMRRMTSLEV